MLALVTLGAASPVHADTGVFFTETFTFASYEGGLDAYGKGGARFTFGIDIRQREWTTEVLGGCIIEHYEGDARSGGYCFGGVDLRKTWQLNRLRPYRDSHAGVRLSLGAGPRYFVGDASLTGYGGPGISASARLEGDVWVIGYFLTAGFDAMWMRMPADSVAGGATFVGFGAKLGWL